MDAGGGVPGFGNGLPAFAAAAAVLGRELTVPEVAQTVVLTRVPGRASKMPEAEQLAAYADRVEAVELPGMHVVMWDAFDEVADAVERFLENSRPER